MPIQIDPTNAAALAALHAAKRYPAQIAKRLWVLNNPPPPPPAPQPPQPPQPTFKVVSTVTHDLGGAKGDIVWYGFRSPSNRRLAQFHACQLSAAQARDVELYRIGAVGNRFDVDLLITDLNGKLLTGVLKEALGFSTMPKPVTLQPKGSGISEDFYFARHAKWLADAAGARAENLMKLETAGAGVACILWAISFRHAAGGLRTNDPFTIPVSDTPPPLNQDNDGSPGDPEPGGDCP